jgi:hypothetical protein
MGSNWERRAATPLVRFRRCHYSAAVDRLSTYNAPCVSTRRRRSASSWHTRRGRIGPHQAFRRRARSSQSETGGSAPPAAQRTSAGARRGKFAARRGARRLSWPMKLRHEHTGAHREEFRQLQPRDRDGVSGKHAPPGRSPCSVRRAGAQDEPESGAPLL